MKNRRDFKRSIFFEGVAKGDGFPMNNYERLDTHNYSRVSANADGFPMKNILSYQPGTKFTGQEILDWARFHVENDTSHARQGRRILRLYAQTLNPTRFYIVKSNYETFGCGQFRHEPLVIRLSRQEV